MLHGIPVERLNLNIPLETRDRIRRIAERRQLKEAEAARELLMSAVEREEREEFYRQMERSQSPELRQRLRALTTAMDELGGRAR